MDTSTNPSLHLHMVHRITAGTRHANSLPEAPEGRPLKRIWTVIDAEKLREMGPIHNVTAFLEDRVHDYRIVDGKLHYYSRITATGAEVNVVLDYETDAERNARMKRLAQEYRPASALKPR